MIFIPVTLKEIYVFLSWGEAVENAVKVARYYTKRPAIITFTNGYHGRSYMGMALSARMIPFKQGFGPFPGDIYRLPFPDEFRGITLEDTKEPSQHYSEVTAHLIKLLQYFLNPFKGKVVTI